MNYRAKCLLSLAATAFLWSLGGVIVKSVAWNPLAITSSRAAFAMLTLVLLARRGLYRRSPELGPSAGLQWLGGFWLAALSYCFVAATKLTTAANAILLQYTAPVWVALLAPWILKEKTPRGDWLFIGLTLGGLVLFFLDSLSGEGLAGIALAIMSGLAFAGLALTMRRAGRNGPPMSMMIYGNLLAAAGGIFFWRAPWPGAADWALIAAAGVFQFGIPYYLFTKASQGVSTLEMVLVTALEPILNPLWVFLAIGERPGFWSLLGGAMVLVTVTAWSVLKSRREYPTKAIKRPS